MRRYKILKAKFILAFSSIFICCELFAGGQSTTIKLYFNQNSDHIIDNYNLKKLSHLIDSTRLSISKVEVVGYSSPDGSEALNVRLSKSRAAAVREYLTVREELPASIIYTSFGGVAWSRLESITQNQKLPYAPEIKSIVELTDKQNRNTLVEEMDGGQYYEHLLNSIYPLLRYALVTIHYFEEKIVPLEIVEEELSFTHQEPKSEDDPTPLEVESVTLHDGRSEVVAKPLFALKTNLLFDIATLINLELEIPIGSRWSIAAEYIFPWWITDNHEADSKRNRTQLLNGNLEGRYWLGDRSSRSILTGWFVGLYTGAGSYDFERSAEGYQGEFFLAAGLCGGYAHTINRAENLRLEYSLGIGYLSTDYQYYHAEFCNNGYWHAIEQRSGRYWWLGPSRARVSLSWLINCNERK